VFPVTSTAQASSNCVPLSEDPKTAAEGDILWAIRHLNLDVSLCGVPSSCVETLTGNNSLSAWRMKVLDEHADRRSSIPLQEVATRGIQEERTSISSVTCTSSTMEWSAEEEQSVRSAIKEFCNDSEQTAYNFPPGQGSRMRKLIHHFAEAYGLSHKSVGKQNSKRFVVVTKKVKSIS